jgi:hypothetical protein
MMQFPEGAQQVRNTAAGVKAQWKVVAAVDGGLVAGKMVGELPDGVEIAFGPAGERRTVVVRLESLRYVKTAVWENLAKAAATSAARPAVAPSAPSAPGVPSTGSETGPAASFVEKASKTPAGSPRASAPRLSPQEPIPGIPSGTLASIRSKYGAGIRARFVPKSESGGQWDMVTFTRDGVDLAPRLLILNVCVMFEGKFLTGRENGWRPGRDANDASRLADDFGFFVAAR